MILSETQLRKIIAKELKERFNPSASQRTNKPYYPTLFGKTKRNSIEGSFIGGEAKQGFYVLIDSDEKWKLSKMGGHKVQDQDNVYYIMKAVKANGNTIDEEKLKRLVDEGRVIWVQDLNYLHEPSSSDEDAGIASFMRDSGIEAGAAITAISAAALLAAGLAPVAAAVEAVGNGFNVADFFNKLDQSNYLGAIFAALGLIPGGDAIGLLKKIGKLDDVFPASLADDIAREIIKLVEGDTHSTLAELVNAYTENRDIDKTQINPFITKLKDAGVKLADSFRKAKGASVIAA